MYVYIYIYVCVCVCVCVCNLNTNWQRKGKEQFVAHRDDSSVVKWRTKLLRHFEGYLEFFLVFQKFYLFITRFAAQETLLRNAR